MISIIIPLYNCEKYITLTINSVIYQTEKNWELIIIDDCSTDDSAKIVKSFVEKDKRIKYTKLDYPSGSPTKPRNLGISLAKGRYIAFLDSDDIWVEDKLESQLKLFDQNQIALVFSNYEKITEDGLSKDRFIVAPNFVDYNILIKGNVIACSSCMWDLGLTGKLYFTNQGHEDFAMWLKILKMGFFGINTNKVHLKYRLRTKSVSSNKFKAIIWTYNIFRTNESFCILKSIRYSTITLLKSFNKSLK
jgi:teichuronic acid biosynthesis glycosyltransferase TuaG